MSRNAIFLSYDAGNALMLFEIPKLKFQILQYLSFRREILAPVQDFANLCKVSCGGLCSVGIVKIARVLLTYTIYVSICFKEKKLCQSFELRQS